MAFFIWFAISPLLSEVRTTLGLTKKQIWTSSVVGVGGTFFMRFLLGPLCDKFGPRSLMALTLCVASIPTGCTGLVNSYPGLVVLRLFIGIAGGTFVMCQFWMIRMFAKNVVGTATGIVAGWGNLGGGVTQLVMGSVLFPLFKWIFDGNAEKAWRTVCVVPAVVTFFTGIICYYAGDDAPKGNYTELKKHGNLPEVSAVASFRRGALNFNTWILFYQYAACFGVELTMNNAAALYFKDEFGQTTESAAAIASIFGWMNIFARGMGGFFCDKMNSKMGMKGRILIHTFFLIGEGIMILVFSRTKSLASSIVCMIIFSLFVQAAEGSTFGIVPYVDAPATGSISGVVGAGGNAGAVGFGMAFRGLEYSDAFLIMSMVVLGSGIASLFLIIKGHAGLLFGTDSEDNIRKWKNGIVPNEDGTTLIPPEYDTSTTTKKEVDNDSEEFEL